MNNPFDYVPSGECRRAYEELECRIEALRGSDEPGDAAFGRELEGGKMLGVMIAEDGAGGRHVLYAFSGQIGDCGFYYPGFVGPVFDYLQPDGYFRMKEREISRMSEEISGFERGEYGDARMAYEGLRGAAAAEIRGMKEAYRMSRLERERRRERGGVSDAEDREMIRASQYEKGEIRRARRRLEGEMELACVRFKEAQGRLDMMKDVRRRESERLQDWLFSNFQLQNGRGESRSLSEIFRGTSEGVPPTGAGECCGPKLLQACYREGWRPVEMAEYWYGKPRGGELRVSGHYYAACRGRCLPVLTWMLEGVDVEPALGSESWTKGSRQPEMVYENEWFCVVDKPSGMLSVPGKGEVGSVEEWLLGQYGGDRYVRMVHRLDQDTSGLMIAAKTPETYKILQRMFASRVVKKTYVAMLEGDYEERGLPESGVISLRLGPDWVDRPRQKVDEGNGKESVTDYRFRGVEEGRSRVEFHPLTGRTHQLRVHSASERGLGMSIVGDRLYGRGTEGGERLMLHAKKIEYTFPMDGKVYVFESEEPF